MRYAARHGVGSPYSPPTPVDSSGRCYCRPSPGCSAGGACPLTAQCGRVLVRRPNRRRCRGLARILRASCGTGVEGGRGRGGGGAPWYSCPHYALPPHPTQSQFSTRPSVSCRRVTHLAPRRPSRGLTSQPLPQRCACTVQLLLLPPPLPPRPAVRQWRHSPCGGPPTGCPIQQRRPLSSPALASRLRPWLPVSVPAMR
jgi:hypothetical protein